MRGAWSVDIRSLGCIKSRYRVGRYIVQAYISEQCGVLYSSMSRNWISRTVKEIREFTKETRKKLGLKQYERTIELYNAVDAWLGTKRIPLPERIGWFDPETGVCLRQG